MTCMGSSINIQATDTTQSQQSSQPFRLLDLPAEIRAFILELALLPLDGCQLDHWTVSFYDAESEPNEFALLLVNKQLAAESLDILYRGITLRVNIPDYNLPEALDLLVQGEGVEEVADYEIKILRGYLKNFRHVILYPWLDEAYAVECLKELLHLICDVYDLPGRTVEVQLDTYKNEPCCFDDVFEVLKEYGGKSTEITIEDCTLNVGESTVKDFCANFGFTFID